jgi:hypothetical protein
MPDGRAILYLTPLELLDRLAQRNPPPRRHRHRYHGVFAPNAPLRAPVTAWLDDSTTHPPTRPPSQTILIQPNPRLAHRTPTCGPCSSPASRQPLPRCLKVSGIQYGSVFSRQTDPPRRIWLFARTIVAINWRRVCGERFFASRARWRLLVTRSLTRLTDPFGFCCHRRFNPPAKSRRLHAIHLFWITAYPRR